MSHYTDDPVYVTDTNDSLVYARLLLQCGKGHPLWNPQPAESPNVATQQGSEAEEVQIGDVGVLSNDGAFTVFFNIVTENSAVINDRRNIPADLESVTISDCPPYPNSRFPGAVFKPEMHPPDSARTMQFVRGYDGYGDTDSLFLVTGFTKARSWATALMWKKNEHECKATFAKNYRHNDKMTILTVPGHPTDDFKRRRMTHISADRKLAVFLHGLLITRRLARDSVLNTDTAVDQLRLGKELNSGGSFLKSRPSIGNQASGAGNRGGRRLFSKWRNKSASPEIFNPLLVINRYILRASPAEFAIIEDSSLDDLSGGDPPRANYLATCREDELIRTISSHYCVVVEDALKFNGGSRDSIESPWKRVMEEADRYGDGRVKEWKEELVANLFLAGLLTLTLTFFTIESYRWLSEDPSAAIVSLLTQISRQIGNPTSAVPSADSTFQPSSSVIRINCFWFLSLTIAMVSTLVGLLCRQWLSDHFQETHTRTPEESIALQRLRIDALHRWGVVLIMRALPVCLQMALLLFFAGLMELLWLRNIVVFAIAVVVAGTAFYIYVATAFLPTILAVQQVLPLRANYDTHDPKNLLDHLPTIESLCPFKSVQSWVVFSVTRSFLAIPAMSRLLYMASNWYSFGRFRMTPQQQLLRIKDWPAFDLDILRKFETIHPELRVYESIGLEWLLKTFRGTPTMAAPLSNAIRSAWGPYAAAATNTAFNQWGLFAWKSQRKEDIEAIIQDPDSYFSGQRVLVGLHSYPGASERSPLPSLLPQLLLYQTSWDRDDFDWQSRYEMTEKLYQTHIPELIRVPFMVPFYQVEELWNSLDERKMGLKFLPFYEGGWRIARSLDKGHHDQLALVIALTNHILTEHHMSAMMTEKVGLSFIEWIDRAIIDERLHDDGDWAFADILPRWERALARLRKVHQLPLDYFKSSTSPDSQISGEATSALEPTSRRPDSDLQIPRAPVSDSGAEVEMSGWVRRETL
ncbi:hypothetical protein PQX77_009532 [Marasmius sp. AFHP31]|nr:hypothetical protein PQX77_009532 [Marasmius sp. AFHP31]